MNLAIQSLLLVAGLVPGIAFVQSYYAGKFTRELASLSTLCELALYFFWAIVIDSIILWGLVSEFTPRAVATFFELASGHLGPDLQTITLNLGRSGWVAIAWRYTLIGFLSALAGTTLRRIVWALRLDVHVPVLRMKAEWFYALQGRQKGVSRLALPQADVLVSHPDDGTRLYAGIVAGFGSTRDGELDRLMLVAAQRYSGRGSEMKLKAIPGDLLILEGKTIHSINMRYTSRADAGLDTPKTRWGWFRALVRAFLRSFFLEEP